MQARTVSWLLLVTSLLTGPISAQRLPPRIRGVAPTFDASPVRPMQAFADDAQRRIRPTHWLTGALVGGVAVGAFGGIVGRGLCTNSDVKTDCTWPTLGSALLGAAVGFTAGALVGGLFPKAEQPAHNP